ncbi:MAG: hypothetical protein ACYT04_81665 [Nostoc sp.]
MTKQKISSKVVQARCLAIYELDKFIEFIRTIAPELELHQSIMLAVFLLSRLPELFKENPALMDQLKDVATDMKLKRRP